VSTQSAARLAGAMFLVVIVAVLASSTLQGDSGGDMAEMFRTIADNTLRMRASVVTLIIAAVTSLVLGTMLYAVTKRQDENLAMLALAWRVAEAGPYVVQILGALALLSLSEAPTTADEQLGTVVAHAVSWSINVGATFFAVSSMLFAYLLLKGRMIPIPLAVLGAVASLILVVGIPLETAAGSTTAEGASIVMWLPMFVFEIVTGVWLLVKGVRTTGPETRLRDRDPVTAGA
jgi:hypothetical protein